MSELLGQLTAITRADVAIRLRRTSTVIAFLVLTVVAWKVVPDPATGRTLLTVENQRVLYSTTTIAIGTGSLAALFLGLFGFYAVSNAIARDVRSRCGLIIASTPLSSGGYLLGRFFANVLFLLLIASLFGVVALVMVGVRGEAAVEPFQLLWIYLLILAPVITFTAAAALVFESVPLLSGRFGDVAYFILFMGLMGGMSTLSVTTDFSLLVRSLDFTGLGFILATLKETLATTTLSIGASPFDRSQPPIHLERLTITGEALVGRLLAALAPLSFVAVAALFFHRFDPAHTRGAESGTGARGSRLTVLTRPLGSAASLLPPLAGGNLAGAAWTDARMTFLRRPWIVAVVMVSILLSLLLSTGVIVERLLPVLIIAFALAVSDLVTRDQQSGTKALLSSMPLLRERRSVWKIVSSALLGLLILGAPALRILLDGSGLLVLHLLTGLAFIAAASMLFGTLTGNPKLFTITFLTFGYIALSEAGNSAVWDFAGLGGTATHQTLLLYAAIALALLAFAALAERRLSA